MNAARIVTRPPSMKSFSVAICPRISRRSAWNSERVLANPARISARRSFISSRSCVNASSMRSSGQVVRSILRWSVNAPELVRRELARPSWKGEHVAMGTNTDPYQWVEGRYKLMPGIWEAMRDFANPCSILTKSPLLLRDKELLQQIAKRTSVTANLSVPTLDEKAWRATEPHTPNPRARLEAVGELNRAGIPAGVLVAPPMPRVHDPPQQGEPVPALGTEAGGGCNSRN